MAKRKIKIPTKKQLEKDIGKFVSMREIAEKYNVSIPTVYNWLRKYDLKSIEQKVLSDKK